jgi:membrane peptidoglycan carboxypeptidase
VAFEWGRGGGRLAWIADMDDKPTRPTPRGSGASDGWSTPRKVAAKKSVLGPAKKAPGKKAPGKKVVAKNAPATKAASAKASSPLGPLPEVDAEDPLWRRLWVKNRRRRIRKKRRIAAMSKRRRIARRCAVTGTWVLALFTALMVTTVALFYLLSNVPRPEDLPLAQVVTVQYADGSTMFRIGTEDRIVVPLSEVPDSLKWAVISTEDRNFYGNPGFSVTATTKAALSNLFGGDSRGGSGITQQYVKNAYLSSERTLTRKIKELMISVKLAREYSKDEILGFYLNTVYFGRGVWGIEAAARSYFHKHVSDLSTAESAVLAGLLRDPGYYDPIENPEPAKARWDLVLQNMVDTKHLTQAEADSAAYPKVFEPNPARLGVTSPEQQLIKSQVFQELDEHGLSEDELSNKGAVIRTTIDKKAQKAATSAIKQTFDNLTDKQKNLKNALVAVDPKTGAVLAYYGGPGGGKGYDGKADWNDYAGVGMRPPGSSFKPYTLATVLSQTLNKTKDKPKLTLSSSVDGSYCVQIQGRQICNDPSDRQYSSKSVTIANAMKWSLNTTFDLLAEQAGPDAVAATAHKAGIPEKDPNGKPTLVGENGETGFGIGIGDYPVRTIDQAVGFATFANGGVTNPAYFVQRVRDSGGTVLYKHGSDDTRALDPKIANDVTLALQPVPGFSGVSLAGGRVSAGKTGTSGIFEDPEGNNSDAWMVGYTPQVSTAVWVGSGNSTDPIFAATGRPEYGRDLPGRTWKLFMDTFLSGKPNLPMATKQMVGDGVPPPSTSAPRTSPTPTPTTSATTSAPPTSSAAPTSSVPPAPSTSQLEPVPVTTPPSRPARPSPTCTPGLLGLGCGSASATPPHSPAGTTPSQSATGGSAP